MRLLGKQLSWEGIYFKVFVIEVPLAICHHSIKDCGLSVTDMENLAEIFEKQFTVLFIWKAFVQFSTPLQFPFPHEDYCVYENK